LEAALAELNSQRGKQFDALVVDACVRVVSTGRVDLCLEGRKSEHPEEMDDRTGGGHDAERNVWESN